VFSLWFLMCHLALNLPTVLQIEISYTILFHKGSVSQFTNLNHYHSYHLLQFPPEKCLYWIWDLIDLNLNLQEPSSIFRYGLPFFTVCMAPLHSENLGWINKLGYRRFYMKPWSILVVVQVYVDLTMEVNTHILQSHFPQ